MTKTNQKSVSIAPDHNQPALSKGQKAFNSLIKQIEKRRARLSAWESSALAFHQKFAADYVPLEQTLADLQIRLIHRLDEACDQKGLTKAEHRTASDLVAEMAGDLASERDDPELKELYNKHSGSDYDREAAAEMEDMKRALEGMLGAELGDDLDMSSPEAVYERVRAEMEQHWAQHFVKNRAGEEPRAARKKTAKQIAAEARVEAKQVELTLSIREVYRKLASALHPDRETDPPGARPKNIADAARKSGLCKQKSAAVAGIAAGTRTHRSARDQ